MPVYVPVNSITMKNSTYTDCTNITAVNLDNITWVDNTAQSGFENCSNLIQVTNAHNAITNMNYTFKNDTTLITVPTIPSSITNMIGTFDNCNRFNKEVNIPSSVTNMYSTFANCTNYINNVNITSEVVSNAANIFYNTTLSKNIYIPYYKNYTNLTNTATRNSFVAAGYDTTGTKEGVYLNNNKPYITINPTPSDATIKYIINGVEYTQKSIAVPLGTVVEYTVSRTGYAPISDTVIVATIDNVIPISLIPYNYTLTINPTPFDATVTFNTGIVDDNSVTAPYGTAITYTVSKSEYRTITATRTITQDETVNVTLEYEYIFPTTKTQPTTYTETLVDSIVTNNTYHTGTINEEGWYRIATRADTGGGQWSSQRGGATGGCISDAIVYLYKGSKYLIWGSKNRYTGYPSPSDVLGGCGGNVTWTEAGGGGGGAGNNGRHVHSDAGWGSGGSGCIIGVNNDGTTLTESWNHANFSVNSVECMILAGGGGGGSGDNGEPRPGGAGGGAWGSGGENSYAGGSSGPGGTGFGRGGCNYGYWAGPGAGAWCTRDYTTNNFTSGTGVKSGNSCTVGSTYIYKLNY